ncbi:MAG: hypothetical protein LHW52_05050, partial [Candidatus Cloacimonetes bacterium]|nr:hypothetical protein [Candidatus Cloacimonadota bacterium]
METSLPVPPEPAAQPTPVVSDITHAQEIVNANFTLLDPGEEFRGYKILRMLNKDAEGIKYIAEKAGIEYVLKVFYKSSFHNMDTLFALQMRLSRLNHLKDVRVAKVAEVNQSHSPAYMAVEYVHGVSLAELKKYNPERITEDFVRKLSLTLISTAQMVCKQGLTLSSLTLNGVMLKDGDEPVILSSGIVYEEVDEREDVFSLGALMAQLLAQNTLYMSLYTKERLKTSKFVPVVGVTMDLNR